jgi:hypothetical protein
MNVMATNYALTNDAQSVVSGLLPDIRFNDRIAIFGQTGTGKTILAHYIFRTVKVRLPSDKRPEGQWRLCIDVTDSIFDDALAFYDPLNIPWDLSSSLRYVPNMSSTESEQDFNDLYLGIMAHGDVWVWLDEANEVSSAHKTIPGLRQVLLQGRKFQIGHCAVTPRPVDISRSIFTQSQHLFIFPLTDNDDRTRVAKNIGLEPDELEEVMATMPDFGFLWYDVRSRTLLELPPIPFEVVEELE